MEAEARVAAIYGIATAGVEIAAIFIVALRGPPWTVAGAVKVVYLEDLQHIRLQQESLQEVMQLDQLPRRSASEQEGLHVKPLQQGQRLKSHGCSLSTERTTLDVEVVCGLAAATPDGVVVSSDSSVWEIEAPFGTLGETPMGESLRLRNWRLPPDLAHVTMEVDCWLSGECNDCYSITRAAQEFGWAVRKGAATSMTAAVSA